LGGQIQCSAVPRFGPSDPFLSPLKCWCVGIVAERPHRVPPFGKESVKGKRSVCAGNGHYARDDAVERDDYRQLVAQFQVSSTAATLMPTWHCTLSMLQNAIELFRFQPTSACSDADAERRAALGAPDVVDGKRSPGPAAHRCKTPPAAPTLGVTEIRSQTNGIVSDIRFPDASARRTRRDCHDATMNPTMRRRAFGNATARDERMLSVDPATMTCAQRGRKKYQQKAWMSGRMKKSRLSKRDADENRQSHWQ